MPPETSLNLCASIGPAIKAELLELRISSLERLLSRTTNMHERSALAQHLNITAQQMDILLSEARRITGFDTNSTKPRVNYGALRPRPKIVS